MPGPVISVKFKAGSAEFFEDLTKVKVGVRQFGQEMNEAGRQSVSGLQATQGALRIMYGGLNNNLRIAERFVSTFLGLGPILQKAFGLIGGIAFLGLLTRLGEEVKKFYTEIRDAPEKLAGAFRALDNEVAASNAQLEVNLDNINKEIARLEGKRPNTLKEMIDEANLSAIKLRESLDQSFAKFWKTLDENKPGFLRQLFGGEASTYNVRMGAGGLTGTAGIQETLDKASAQYDEQLQTARSLDEVNKIRQERAIAQQTALNQEIVNYTRLLKDAQEAAKPTYFKGYDAGGLPVEGNLSGKNEKANIAALTEYIKLLNERKRTIEVTSQSEDAQHKLNDLQANKSASRAERPYQDKVKELQDQIRGIGVEINAVGQSEGAQVLAKAFLDSSKAIDEINKHLERINPSLKLSADEVIVLRDLFNSAGSKQFELGWDKQINSATESAKQQTEEQKKLASAIGMGYEAVKRAAVETEVMGRVGVKNYQDADYMADHAAKVEEYRNSAAEAYDAKHATQVTNAIQKAEEQIEIERAMGDAQARGAEAVRQAANAVRERYAALSGATNDQIEAERKLYTVQRQNLSAEAVAKINEKTEATERLAAATLKGAEAIRQANLENKIAEIRRSGDQSLAVVPTVGMMSGAWGLTPGFGPQEAAARREEGGTHSLAVSQASVSVDRVRAINEQIRLLTEAKETLGDTLAIEEQLRNLENERIHALAEESLGLRGARDGVRAFFIEMQADAKSSAQIIYESLNSALDKVTANIGKLGTGQKTDWAKSFQEIGGQMEQSSIKSLAQKGLGALGHLFHVDIGNARPDGTKGNPLWVQLATAGGPSIPGLGGGGSSSGASGGGIFSGLSGMIAHLFGAGHAGGGPVEPGMIYPVGEDGPEFFSPGTRGTIIPHGSGGGNMTVNYNVNAPGAELGAHNRILRMLEATHEASVAKAVQASHEHSRRVPSK